MEKLSEAVFGQLEKKYKILLRNIIFTLAGLQLFFFLLSIIFGAYLNFSPVPFMDSWSGMVGFYVEAQERPLAWWVQHNEHRIFFSKLLFWLDMRYFGGLGLLLIPMNIVLLVLSWWLLVSYANNLIKFPSGKERFLFSAVLGMLCFAWMQSQNIIWSFQSQFILVYFFPLLSFYCWAIAVQAGERSLRWRILSLMLGVASAYCMANGVAVLPALAVLSWLTERSLRWFISIIVCSVVSIAVFSIGYQQGTATAFSYADLPRIINFALAYLGGPLFVIFGKINWAVGAGVIALLLSLYMFLRRSVYHPPAFALALFTFIGYVFATAGITAYGRSFFPIELAASSRYLTPVLMMWGAMLILLVARHQHPLRVSMVALAVFTVLLLSAQMKAFKVDTSSVLPTPHEKAVAALSLQLDIDDQRAKRRLHFWWNPKIDEQYRRAAASKVSIFSTVSAYPADQLGKPLSTAGGAICSGQVTFSKKVDDKRSAYLVAGSLALHTKNIYRYILFADAQGLVAGVAILGRDRKGVDGNLGAHYFDGYLLGSPAFTQMQCLE